MAGKVFLVSMIGEYTRVGAILLNAVSAVRTEGTEAALGHPPIPNGPLLHVKGAIEKASVFRFGPF